RENQHRWKMSLEPRVVVKCPRLLYQSQCMFSVYDSAGMRSGAGVGVLVSCSGSLVLAFFMPASPLVFVQTLPAARSPANCVDAADCNLAAKLRSFVLHGEPVRVQTFIPQPAVEAFY